MSYGSPFPPAPAAPPPAPAGHGVHPLTIGRVFELSFRMLRFHWRALIGAAALLLVPVHIVQAIAQTMTGPLVNAWMIAWQQWVADVEDQLRDVAPGQPVLDLAPMPPFPEGFGTAVALSVAVGVVVAVVGWLAAAAVAYAAGRTYAGAEPSATEAVRQALRRAPSLIGAQLLAFVAIVGTGLLGGVIGVLLIAQGAGLIAFMGVVLIVSSVVLFFYLVIRWAFLAQAIMLENAGALDALGRSWRLVGGSVLRVLGYMIVYALTVGLITLLVFSVISLVISRGQPAVDPAAIALESALSAVYYVVLTPFATIFFTLLYFDIRWRKGELAPATTPQPGSLPEEQATGPYGQPPHGGQPPYGGPPTSGGPPPPG